MLGTRLDIKPYERQYRSAVLELNTVSQWTHEHADWYSIGQWLDQERGHVYLAWRGAEVVGYIGLSLPLEGCAWIRFLGIRAGRSAGQIVAELWQRAERHCRLLAVHRVAALMVTNWLSTYLRRCGFACEDAVITMSHAGSRRPAAPTASATIRPAEAHDVARIALVDRLAFPPLWRLTRDEVWQALRVCAHATVADVAGRLVAYQFGTRHEDLGHLARLAVAPAHQRKGIGSLLLYQFLGECQRMPSATISVNTQLSNKPSQELYQRFGFFRNNKDLDLWQKCIA